MSSGSLQGDPFPLIWVKVYYFASFCFFATYHRYLTLFLEGEGLTAAQIGALTSVMRLISTVATPFWSALADSTKRARSIMQVSLVATSVTFLSLALPVPEGSGRLVARTASLWVFSLLSTPQGCLRDALALAACAQDADRWGKARVYGAIGWGAMHLILGPLFDSFGFVVMFVGNALLSVVLLFVTQNSVPMACSEVRREVSASVVLDIFIRNRAFFGNMIFLGAGFSMVEGMLFLLLRELEASTLLCGLSVVVTVVFELPIFEYAKFILARLGTRNMILLGQAAWVVRAVFYANMTVAWTVLLIEPLHGVTFALVWTAATQHVAKPEVSGSGLEASAQGLLSVCFMGVGPMLGLFFGGMLFDAAGSHAAYGFFSVAVLLSGSIYAICGTDPAPAALGGGTKATAAKLGVPDAGPSIVCDSDEEWVPGLPQPSPTHTDGSSVGDYLQEEFDDTIAFVAKSRSEAI